MSTLSLAHTAFCSLQPLERPGPSETLFWSLQPLEILDLTETRLFGKNGPSSPNLVWCLQHLKMLVLTETPIWSLLAEKSNDQL